MNADTLIKKHEGYKGEVYLCSEGVPTVGWGHALHVGSKVPIGVSELFFKRDMEDVHLDYAFLGLELDEVREAVVLNMIFNLGLSGFKKFKQTISLIRNGNYDQAATEMLNSKWAGQVGSRANELSKMMASGEWPKEKA